MFSALTEAAFTDQAELRWAEKGAQRRPGGQAATETAVATKSAHSSDVPPVHVAADHEIGRAVPEVDTREVAQRVAQLREAAFRFQAVDQDLGRKSTCRGVPSHTAGLHPTRFFSASSRAGPLPPLLRKTSALPLNTLASSR